MYSTQILTPYFYDLSDNGYKTGAPNNGFFLKALKTLFRLSRVLLDL